MSGAGVPVVGQQTREGEAHQQRQLLLRAVAEAREVLGRCPALQRLRRQVLAEHEPRLRQHELQIGRQPLDHRLGKAVARARGGAIEFARQQLQRGGLLLHVTAAHFRHRAGIGQFGETRRDIVGAVGSAARLRGRLRCGAGLQSRLGPLARHLGGFRCLLQRGKARIVGRLLAPGGAIAHRSIERRLGLGSPLRAFPRARGCAPRAGRALPCSAAICSALPAMRVRRPTSSSRAVRSSRAASFSASSASRGFRQLLTRASPDRPRRPPMRAERCRLRGKLSMRALQALHAFRRRCLELRRRLAQLGLGLATFGQQTLGILQRRAPARCSSDASCARCAARSASSLATSPDCPGAMVIVPMPSMWSVTGREGLSISPSASARPSTLILPAPPGR